MNPCCAAAAIWCAPTNRRTLPPPWACALCRTRQTPLGAAPQQAAAENLEERHKIWQDSIRTLKTSPRIWALGIDGMGGDPDGTASTAALQEQWQLLNATVPGAAAYILLQGETVALYQEGKLKIPDSVIPVLTPAPSASSAGGPGPGAQHGCGSAFAAAIS